MQSTTRRARTSAPVAFAAGALLLLAPAARADHTTGAFAGIKADRGTASFRSDGHRRTLSLSDDFRVPDAPDPHWQVVDSQGAVYLLDKLTLKGGREKRTIELPDYVPDVARVQIWCSFAETLLGEASFASPAR